MKGSKQGISSVSWATSPSSCSDYNCILILNHLRALTKVMLLQGLCVSLHLETHTENGIYLLLAFVTAPTSKTSQSKCTEQDNQYT